MKNIKLIFYSFLILILLMSGCDYTKNSGTQPLEDQISVKFKSEISRSEINSIIEAYGAQIIKESTSNYYRIKIPPEKTVEQAKKYFESLPQVEVASFIKETHLIK